MFLYVSGICLDWLGQRLVTRFHLEEGQLRNMKIYCYLEAVEQGKGQWFVFHDSKKKTKIKI